MGRGDIVVFDGRGSFAPLNSGNGPVLDFLGGVGHWLGLSGSDTTYIKRVIGLPGDRVVCCDAGGRLTVNGQPVAEPYLYAGDAPSELKFSVIVPAGRLWLMGDHRSHVGRLPQPPGRPRRRHGAAGPGDRQARTDHLAA